MKFSCWFHHNSLMSRVLVIECGCSSKEDVIIVDFHDRRDWLTMHCLPVCWCNLKTIKRLTSSFKHIFLNSEDAICVACNEHSPSVRGLKDFVGERPHSMGVNDRFLRLDNERFVLTIKSTPTMTIDVHVKRTRNVFRRLLTGLKYVLHMRLQTHHWITFSFEGSEIDCLASVLSHSLETN